MFRGNGKGTGTTVFGSASTQDSQRSNPFQPANSGSGTFPMSGNGFSGFNQQNRTIQPPLPSSHGKAKFGGKITKKRNLDSNPSVQNPFVNTNAPTNVPTATTFGTQGPPQHASGTFGLKQSTSGPQIKKVGKGKRTNAQRNNDQVNPGGVTQFGTPHRLAKGFIGQSNAGSFGQTATFSSVKVPFGAQQVENDHVHSLPEQLPTTAFGVTFRQGANNGNKVQKNIPPATPLRPVNKPKKHVAPTPVRSNPFMKNQLVNEVKFGSNYQNSISQANGTDYTGQNINPFTSTTVKSSRPNGKTDQFSIGGFQSSFSTPSIPEHQSLPSPYPNTIQFGKNSMNTDTPFNSGIKSAPQKTFGGSGNHLTNINGAKKLSINGQNYNEVGDTYDNQEDLNDIKKASYESAKDLDGLCIDMCSESQRELHIRVDELSAFEKCFPSKPGKERDLIVKRFQRSSADHKLDIPEEIRPLGVLRKTQLYIEQEIMDREKHGIDPRLIPPRVPELIDLYNFCWDRFRMIRKDCVLQNYRAGGRVHPIVLDIHERIARYHILSEHELCEVPSFVAQQNMEQLGQTLKSLNELYDETRKLADMRYRSPFEAESRSYFILCTLDNGRGLDVLKYVKGLPQDMRTAPHVVFAMSVFVSRHTHDYVNFFQLFRKSTFLQGCLMHRYVPGMRSTALERMNRAYRNQTYSVRDLTYLLCFDNDEQAINICEQHSLIIQPDPDNGSELHIHFGGQFSSDVQLRRNKTSIPVQKSTEYIEKKQGKYKRADVCRGVTEYTSYPRLSDLILESESEERERLYPDRPAYTDQYSVFADFGLPEAQSNVDEEQKNQELQRIAKKHAALQIQRQAMIEKLQQLEDAKEKSMRLQLQQKYKLHQENNKDQKYLKTDDGSDDRNLLEQLNADANKTVETKKDENKLLELKEQQLKKEMLAKEAAEKKKQQALQLEKEKAHKEMMARQQKELEEAQRKIEEEKRRKIAEEARKKMEEERKRAEEERIAQRIAYELEILRREEEEKQKRMQAQQDALRLEKLERQRLIEKAERRLSKQTYAVKKLTFYKWKLYMQQSRKSKHSVAVDSGKFFTTNLDRQTVLRSRVTSMLDCVCSYNTSPNSLDNYNESVVNTYDYKSEASITAGLWKPFDVTQFVSSFFIKKYPGEKIILKIIVADILKAHSVKDCSTIFGRWCATKFGIVHQTMTFNSDVVVHINDNVGIVCRYVTSETNLSEASLMLEGSTTIILPVDCRQIRDIGLDIATWIENANLLLSALPLANRVNLLIVILTDHHAQLTSEEQRKYHRLLTVLEESVQNLEQEKAHSLLHVDPVFFNMTSEGSASIMERNFFNILTLVVKRYQPIPKNSGIRLKQLVGNIFATSSTLAQIGDDNWSVAAFQSSVSNAVKSIRIELQNYYRQHQKTNFFPPPELEKFLQDTNTTGLYGNLDTTRDWINKVLLGIEHSTLLPLSSRLRNTEASVICEVYFKELSNLIETLFDSIMTSSEHTTLELKKIAYNAMIPLHNEILELAENSNPESSTSFSPAEIVITKFPWRLVLERIYSTFAEALGSTCIYLPEALYDKYNQQVSMLMDQPPPLKKIKTEETEDHAYIPPPTTSISTSPTSKVIRGTNNKASLAIQKLEAAIEREKQNATAFQDRLRKEMSRWTLQSP